MSKSIRSATAADIIAALESRADSAEIILALQNSSAAKPKPTTEGLTLEQLAEALAARPDIKLLLDAAVGNRPDSKELSEMDADTFGSHFARTIEASAGQRRTPPGSRQGLVRESTPATRPAATELSEMDSSTFADHYAATIMRAKSGR